MAQSFENWGASVPHGVEAHFYPACESTNAIAADYARSGTSSPIWIVGGTQSGGKGRKGRTWVSEAGNLYASLLFAPAITPGSLSALPFLTALAVRNALIKLGVDAGAIQCKWPNDILLGGRKVCGILIESSARSAERLDYVVIGIGINLKHSPAEAQFKATSLNDHLNAEITPRMALNAVASCLREGLDAWDTNEFEPIRAEWTNCAWGLGKIRRINTATEAFDAKLVGLDGQGGLLVQLENGTERQIVAADIFPTAMQSDEDT